MFDGQQSGNDVRPTGHVADVGLLDLRFAKQPEDLSGIESISDVGVVLVPEELAWVLTRIPVSDVGVVVPVPEGDNVNCMAGQIRLTGGSLEGGAADSILVVVGQMFITSPVRSVGYKEIRVFGQVFAPRGSEVAIMAKLTQMNGQVFYLPENPRIVMGEQTIGAEFLELLPNPTAFVVMGNLTFESDVPRDLLREKVPEIVLMGEIVAPKALVPLLEVITVEKMGNISAVE